MIDTPVAEPPLVELDNYIDGIVTALLENAPTAAGKARQVVFDVAGAALSDELIQHTVRFIADIRDSDEGGAGLSAFLQKRPPAWTTAITETES